MTGSMNNVRNINPELAIDLSSLRNDEINPPADAGDLSGLANQPEPAADTPDQEVLSAWSNERITAVLMAILTAFESERHPIFMQQLDQLAQHFVAEIGGE